MVAVFPIMNGKIEEHIKEESILPNLQNNTKQVVIYESGHPVLKVECGTTLEVMKLLYESEYGHNGVILGVRPRNKSEIPCIITLHESKLEESGYDVIIKDKKTAPSPDRQISQEKSPSKNSMMTRCIDCSRESWKSKRYTTVGMNTEISLNPLADAESIRTNPLSTTISQTAITEPSYPTRNRGRPPIQRPVPLATHGSGYNNIHMKAALPNMSISNGITSPEADYLGQSHYRPRSPRVSPSHRVTGHTKICYPPPNKPVSLERSPFDQSHTMRHRMYQRSLSPHYHDKSPVYSTSSSWTKDLFDMFPPSHYSSSNRTSYRSEILPSPHRYTQYHSDIPPPMVNPPSQGAEQTEEGEPPVYVLPNDFDLQRDRVDPQMIPYHSPRGNPSAEHSHLSNKRPSSVSKCDRESPVSDSGKSASEETLPSDVQNEHKLACKICKQFFATKSTLYKHLRGHSSDEKPFKCNECGQGFTLSSNLRQHRIIHRGYKPFQCEYCGKKFMRSNVYKQHRRIHTGEQMHKCDLCPSEFLQRYALIKHKKKTHNIETFDK